MAKGALGVIIHYLKKLPIDLGQGHQRASTKGKLIALSLVPQGQVKKDKIIKKKAALDVGCREGIQSEWLKGKGYKVTSIDIQTDYGRIVDVNKKLPFKDNSFDLIWCSEVIEHLKNPAKTVKEFYRILRPGGKMLLTTPNSYCWLFRLFSLIGLPPKRLQRDDHIHFFHVKDVKKMFPNATLYGFFPYFLVKFQIKSNWAINWLSPTFVIDVIKY